MATSGLPWWLPWPRWLQYQQLALVAAVVCSGRLGTEVGGADRATSGSPWSLPWRDRPPLAARTCAQRVPSRLPVLQLVCVLKNRTSLKVDDGRYDVGCSQVTNRHKTPPACE